jgi:peptidoglycan/xylan/chitin deacetylase (PgdA/CDA1 family)
MATSWIRRAATPLKGAGVTRQRVAAVRLCVERATLAALKLPGAGRAGGRILAYHSVGTPQWGVNDVSPARFRRHLEIALAGGYKFVHPDQIARTGGRPDELAVSFDDGLASVLENAAPILRELGIPWSMFIVSDWAEAGHPSYDRDLLMDWRQVERLAAYGATIGSHSVTHRNFGHLSPSEAAEELFASREVIERRVGIKPITFAIPFGQSRDWTAAAAAAALAAGYEIVYAQAEATRFPGTVARTMVARTDLDFVFRGALRGHLDRWEEWY